MTLRGTQQTIDYYQGLLAEMKDRIQAGIGAIPREQYLSLINI